MPSQAIPPIISPPPLPKSSRSWWQRNGKWAIPAVCIGAVVFFAGFMALIVSAVFGMMKSSDAYKQAFARASANPAVVRALGSPVRAGLFVSGKIEVNGPTGRAELAIPLAGPKGKAMLYVAAEKSAGEWRYSTLFVRLHATGEQINLLEKPVPQPASAGGSSYF